MTRPLNLFAPRDCLPPEADPIPMLRPFWGNPEEGSADPTASRFDEYVERGKHLFRLTELDGCDAAVLPVGWEDVRTSEIFRRKTRDLVAQAAALGKTTIIFFSSDLTEPVPRDISNNALILRTSLTSSRRKSNEFALPGWSEDLLEQYGGSQPSTREKPSRPLIGFCGLADPLQQTLGYRGRRARRWVASKVKGQPGGIGPALRRKALKGLAASPDVDTRFLIEDRFWGGAWKKEPESFTRKQQARERFVDNILSTDYSLCVRGAGNFSYRLYEVLSCGRIPLFIDTDCVLPYDFDIDWRDYCVWVDRREMKNIAEILVEFHTNLSPTEFVDLQRRCRKLWEEKISPLGFFTNFHRHLSIPESTGKGGARALQR